MQGNIQTEKIALESRVQVSTPDGKSGFLGLKKPQLIIIILLLVMIFILLVYRWFLGLSQAPGPIDTRGEVEKSRQYEYPESDLTPEAQRNIF